MAAPVAAAVSLVLNEKREYDECRIQVRLTDGKTMVEKFRATEQLAAVNFLDFNTFTFFLLYS